MKKYYIAENNSKQGPFTIEELRVINLKENTLVWYKGLNDWKEAWQIDELKSVFYHVKDTSPVDKTTNYFKLLIPVVVTLVLVCLYFYRNDLIHKFNLSNTGALVDREVKVLWREKKQASDVLEYDKIRFDTAYLRTMTEPEKAALCLIGSIIGSDCNNYVVNENESAWAASMRRANPTAYLEGEGLRCAITNALELGEFNSKEHLNFLKKWFGCDPEMARILDSGYSFNQLQTNGSKNINYLNLSVKQDTIILDYSYDYYGRDSKDTEYEKTYLKLEGKCLKMLKSKTF